MKALGFLAELERKTSVGLPSLSELSEKLDPAVVPAVLEYLNRGTAIFDVMEATPDPLNPGKFVSGGSSLITDGEWVWRLDLRNYVSAHRLGLPAEFVSRACIAVGSRIFPTVARSKELLRQVLSVAGWA